MSIHLTGTRTMRVISTSISGWRAARRFNSLPLEEQIRLRVAGDVPKIPFARCCIFAHYDPDGTVDHYVRHYLERLRELDADIIFVSTSPSLNTREIEDLKRFCRDIILRENVSADFGSWNLGIHILGEKINRYKQLILVNDSVFGPFQQLGSLFEEMKKRELDIWSLSDSYEQDFHLQSYFLVFEQAVLQSPFFADFWSSFRQKSNKRRLVRAYEVGLSQSAIDRGIRCQSWISSKQLRTQVNPTLFHWEQLIADFDFPFLKTELLKRNRFRSKRVTDWRSIIRSTFPNYDCNLIAEHLRRVGSAVPL